MPNLKSQIKRMKQAERIRLRNKSVKTAIKTTVKRFETALSEQNFEEAKSLLTEISQKLDKAASKGVLHKNTAARKKSRLSEKLNFAEQSTQKEST